MHDSLDKWLVQHLRPTSNDLLFRGHIDGRGDPKKLFVVIARVDPIGRLDEDFNPYIGFVKVWEEAVSYGHGWRFAVGACDDDQTSLEDQMHSVIGQEWGVRGWMRQQVRYCSTSASPGFDISMENMSLTVELARVHGAVVAHLEGVKHSEREQRLLRVVDGRLAVMISGNLIDNNRRNKLLN